MEGGGFWTDMVLRDESDVDGLDDLTFPMTQETQDLPSEAQQLDVQEEQPSQGARRRSTMGLAKRTQNYDPKEDVIVCAAWLTISKDPIVGANQSRSTFWSRALDFFDKHKKTKAVRSESSLMHRWLTIQFQVNKYCACYKAIERRNQSGATIEDKISDAAEMYKELDKDKKTFTLLHCWTKLKGEDKWKAKRAELAELEKQAKKKKQKVSKDSTPRAVQPTNNEDVTKIAAPESEARKRPQGVKKAKEALKRGGGEACMEALDKMWAKKEAFDTEREKKKDERFLVSLELEKKRLAIEEKKAEADLIKEEQEIMSIGMASLNPLQQQYYEAMQQHIIARRFAN